MNYGVVLVDPQWAKIQRSPRVKWVLICHCNGTGDRGQIATRPLCLQWCISRQDRRATLNVVCRVKSMLWWSVNEKSCQKGAHHITLADFRQQAFMKGTSTMKKNEAKQNKRKRWLWIGKKKKRERKGEKDMIVLSCLLPTKTHTLSLSVMMLFPNMSRFRQV